MKKHFLFVLSLVMVLSFSGCDPGDGSSNEAVAHSDFVHHDIVNVEHLLAETSAVEPDARIEVRIDIVNIPDTVAAEGDVLALVGYYLCDSNGDEFNWNNNDTSVDATTGLAKEGTSADFLDTVASACLSYTFFYDAGNSTTDFKFFADGTWTELINDPMETDNNFKIDFASNGYVAGDVAVVTIDASTL